MVERLTFNSRAIEETVASGCASRALACRICSGVIAGGRPRRTPRALAAARPSLVPSMMSSRMNSARAAKTWKTRRPPAVVVSRASCRERNPTPQPLQLRHPPVHGNLQQPRSAAAVSAGVRSANSPNNGGGLADHDALGVVDGLHRW
jgi:hypothetical protein